VVVGGGDMAGEKHNNQIEATTVVVGTVGTAIDGGEARAKGKMSGWQTMRGNRTMEDAMGGGGRQCKAIRRLRTQQKGRRMMQGNQVVDDTKRGEGQTPRTQCSGGQHDKWGDRQRKARIL
jgi:hypothetical protein